MKPVFALAALAAAFAVPALADAPVPADCAAMAARIDEALAGESAALFLDESTVVMVTSYRDEGLKLCATDGYHDVGVETLQFATDFLGLVE